ncbi:hypothetical protein NQZ68_038621 [Dissostichus eleginoides]|nr:hypothetical protein NQZ68_038621 [Dissostichus eleginoides]
MTLERYDMVATLSTVKGAEQRNDNRQRDQDDVTVGQMCIVTKERIAADSSGRHDVSACSAGTDSSSAFWEWTLAALLIRAMTSPSLPHRLDPFNLSTLPSKTQDGLALVG